MGNRELAAYREADVQSASPVEVVIMLYDALVRDMKRVITAIGAGDIQDRVNHSTHAFEVLQQLECSLDMEHGGSTAKDLSRFYSHVRAKVMEVQFKLDPALLERQIEMVLELRQGWVQAMGVPELSPAARASVPAEFAAYPQSGAMDEAQCCQWSA
jgi:flagellar protein FliS